MKGLLATGMKIPKSCVLISAGPLAAKVEFDRDLLSAWHVWAIHCMGLKVLLSSMQREVSI